MWLLLACSGEPEPVVKTPAVWTDEAVHSGVIEAVDPGQDEISEAAWGRVLWTGPTFEQLDVDGSRGIGARELSDELHRRDPLDFDKRKERGALDRAEWAAPFSTPAGQRAVWETLAFVRDETRHLDPSATLPDDDALRVLAAGGSLDADEVQGALAAMEPSWEQAGRAFPEGLLK
ncbi:MAG: hypothetical protein GY913_32200 [Proteobacteria bacterium]|nr:hypothetical protein [Pseudomonadota bacterium]MCP4921584.1 hypothetical protein [Pseudomonadota bacterium]